VLANFPLSRSPSIVSVAYQRTVRSIPSKKARIRHPVLSGVGLSEFLHLRFTKLVVMARVFQGLVLTRVLNVATDVSVIPPVVDGLHHSDDFVEFAIWTDFALGDADILLLFAHIYYQTGVWLFDALRNSHRKHLEHSTVYRS